MKQDNRIKNAIDESLAGVHFNAQDMRSVMRTVRRSDMDDEPVRRRKPIKLDLILSMGMVVVVAVPVFLFAARAVRMQPTPIAFSSPTPEVIHLTPVPPTEQPVHRATPTPTPTPAPETTLSPTQEPESTPERAVTAEDAILAARACYEETCDTSVFTFEEFTVSAAMDQGLDGAQRYIVTMTSIYDNGCAFTVVVSAQDGSVIQYSTPRLATIPSYLSSDSAEVQAWYEKNGAYLFTWPQETQAEFSRRYEGGTLRTAKDGEIPAQQAALIAARYAAPLLGVPEETVFAYPMLYSERAYGDAQARYVVRCYAQGVQDELPGRCVSVTLNAATGEVESAQSDP